MKTLDVYVCKPSRLHIALARRLGDASLGKDPPDEFYPGAPMMPGFERAEPGCLLAMNHCVMPHVDTWLGSNSLADYPRVRRSLFWLISGAVTLKVDGWESRPMYPGDWVVFDHDREHMVLANEKWTGAAWQIKPARKARSAKQRVCAT